MLSSIAQRVAAGATVEFRPSGSSMIPIIHSRDLVTVAPVIPSRLEVGDVVLAKVAGTVYLHKVAAIDSTKQRVQIANNRGRINGWTGFDRVYGICTQVGGMSRPRIADKIRTTPSSPAETGKR